MPIQIGGKAHSYANPTGLLSDCHRRIEMFLGSLDRVAPLLDNPLTDDARSALENSLRYFREAAPKHTADEEQSIFPRLRKLNDPEATAALNAIEPLEREHRHADSLHAEVDRLGNRCLEKGPLAPAEAEAFRNAIAQLLSIYREHIRIEDEVVFPIASRLLTPAEKSAVAVEMAARRK